ncbi:ABC transporter permease [Bacillus sp. CGMCC 1.16541]|uniref:ABC transporter permease n=1 Tax=Bacillus sp. CGMCC 1.16541 TaxID=2185143 RepID=UPI000D7277DF|nr:ABC transporter permease [Bacillus sp. CGMCC 1.16541]
MFWRLLQVEWFKMNGSTLWSLVFLSPLTATIIGYVAASRMDFELPNDWYEPLVFMVSIHAVLFLPLLSGVLVSFICRHEHQAGGWKQLLSLPVKRSTVYLAKGFLIFLLVGCIQALFLLGWLAVGLSQGYTDPLPITLMITVFIGGWMAMLPLIGLQLWVSTSWASFGAPLALNAVFTVPNLMVINSERVSPFYPWSQPFMLMMPQDQSVIGFNASLGTLALVIGGSATLFFIGGLLTFERKLV